MQAVAEIKRKKKEEWEKLVKVSEGEKLTSSMELGAKPIVEPMMGEKEGAKGIKGEGVATHTRSIAQTTIKIDEKTESPQFIAVEKDVISAKPTEGYDKVKTMAPDIIAIVREEEKQVEERKEIQAVAEVRQRRVEEKKQLEEKELMEREERRREVELVRKQMLDRKFAELKRLQEGEQKAAKDVEKQIKQAEERLKKLATADKEDKKLALEEKRKLLREIKRLQEKKVAKEKGSVRLKKVIDRMAKKVAFAGGSGGNGGEGGDKDKQG